GGRVDSRGREGSSLRRVLDRLETERGHNASRAHLLDPAAECLDLFYQHLERTARAEPGVEIVRQDDGTSEEREPAPFPPDREGRDHFDRRGGGCRTPRRVGLDGRLAAGRLRMVRS